MPSFCFCFTSQWHFFSFHHFCINLTTDSCSLHLVWRSSFQIILKLQRARGILFLPILSYIFKMKVHLILRYTASHFVHIQDLKYFLSWASSTSELSLKSMDKTGKYIFSPCKCPRCLRERSSNVYFLYQFPLRL